MLGKKVWFCLLGLMLGGCQGYPRSLNLPYDAGGRGVNTPASELSPQMVGDYLILVSDRKGSQDVFLFDMAQRQLIDLPGLNSLDASVNDPTISEDGRYIAYLGSRLGLADIYVYDRDTGLTQNLTEGLQAEVRRPVISANGAAIAFEANEEGRWNIKIYDRQGNALD
ncbi:Tol biopolymer transporter periplasmic protein [Spirulina major CS-329]|uniref:TolB family protein n=1 Tax=Spirulina TaxID=1154 RepID=UPI0023304410|nr:MULTISPECIES: Tol biopolymer transporter periplasmic protein [Spirulina]MDB9493626.1 Tol biopolymer transporter periplasmic protein [Spirulina subsalsa CS-330]MDB9502382.1 Tol biopolymer transporter periplasmic protein [Spirulina major CS-329]